MRGPQDIDKATNFCTLIVTPVLAALFVAARTVARWIKDRSFAAEDYFCWFALSTFISLCVLYLTVLDTIYDVQAIAMGKLIAYPGLVQDGSRMMRHLFAIQLCFWITLYAVKFSLLCLFKRLTLGLPFYQKLWWGVVVFTLLSFIGCVISEFTSCQPLSDYFAFGQCAKHRDARAQAASLYYSLAVDLITDLLIMALPIRLLWNLQISRIEKACIGLAMSVGVITMICAIVRASSLGKFAKFGQIPISWLALWASIECFIAIVVNCLPSFAVFLRRKILSIKSRDSSNNKGSRSQNHKASQQRNRLRSESVLLDDLVEGEAENRSKASHEGDSDGHEYVNSSRIGLATSTNTDTTH